MGGGIGVLILNICLADYSPAPFISDYTWMESSNAKEKVELKMVKEKYPNGCKYTG
jgi:hypothetical protein